MRAENLVLLRNELTRDEGVRYEAYRDTVGLWTIGYGHLLGSTKRMTEITYSEAEALLMSDIKWAERLVRQLVPKYMEWDEKGINRARCRALVNMSFNLGTRFAGFKNFLAAVNAENWIEAGEAMMQSKWAVQVGQRAVRLRAQIEGEE